MTTILFTALPSLLVGLFLAAFERAQKKRDADAAGRAAARREESLLALDLQMATAKMAFATAVAIKRGHANGEVEEGIRAYEEAKKHYVDFLNRQATDHLTI